MIAIADERFQAPGLIAAVREAEAWSAEKPALEPTVLIQLEPCVANVCRTSRMGEPS